MKLRFDNIIEVMKLTKLSSLMLILMFIVLVGDGFSKEWNGILPCVSTRLDAENILGKHNLPLNVNSYMYKEFRVYVRYERIDKNSPEKDIVEKINVYQDKIIILSKYIKQIPNFRRNFVKTVLDDRITHIHGRAVYRNWKDGFEIWVQKNENSIEVISSFGYFDPAWDCSKRKK